METINKDIRLATYRTAMPVQQYLFGSMDSGLQLISIAHKHSIEHEDLLNTFIILIGDIVLGFYKIEDTVPLLQQELGIDAKTAALLGAEVLDFLAPLSNPNWQPPAEEGGGEDTYTTPVVSKPVVENAHAVQPTAHESHIIPQLRTMAADMENGRSPVRNTFNAAALVDEPVYVSTQPPMSKPASEAPSYTAPLYQSPKPNVDVPLEKPRWG